MVDKRMVLMVFSEALPSSGWPQRGNGPVDAQGREDELLQIRLLVFAIAMGTRQGDRWRLLVWRPLWRQIIPIDTDGRGSKVDRLFIQPIGLIGTHSTGGKNLHGPHGIEALQDAPHGVIMKGVRREGLAQQQGRVLVGKALFQTVQGTAPTQGIEDHAQHNSPGIDPHLGRHQLIDGSVSNVEMATPIALTYKVLFPSISTFETPPFPARQDRRQRHSTGSRRRASHPRHPHTSVPARRKQDGDTATGPS